MRYTVTDVTPLEGYRLAVSFADGRRGVFDMGGYLDLPIFTPLRDARLFAAARAGHGTVVWPGGIDIALEQLYTDCAPLA